MKTSFIQHGTYSWYQKKSHRNLYATIPPAGFIILLNSFFKINFYFRIETNASSKQQNDCSYDFYPLVEAISAFESNERVNYTTLVLPAFR